MYIDDVLIYSANPADYRRHVRIVLERLRKFHLFVKLKKCLFEVTEVPFLGFVLRTDGVAIEASRIEAITE